MGQVCKPREQGEQPISQKSASSDFHVSSDNNIPSRETLLGKQFRRRLEYLSQLHDKRQVDMLPLYLRHLTEFFLLLSWLSSLSKNFGYFKRNASHLQYFNTFCRTGEDEQRNKTVYGTHEY